MKLWPSYYHGPQRAARLLRRRRYQLWKDNVELSRHFTLGECMWAAQVDADVNDVTAVYEIRNPLVAEIRVMPRSDATVFFSTNVPAFARPAGARMFGQTSAVSAGSTGAIGATANLTGANISAQSGAISVGIVGAGTIIPAASLYDWSIAGVVGGIPNRTTVYTTLSAGSTAAQIETAVNNCPSGQVVELGAGTFTISDTINFNNKSNVTLRGQGIGSTILNVTGSRAYNIVIGNTSADYPQNSYTGPSITVNADKGDYTVTLASTTTFSAGDYVAITLEDDTSVPVIGVNFTRSQTFRTSIASKTSTTLTFDDPLPFDCPTSLDPNVHIITSGFSENFGIEDMTIDMINGSIIFGVCLWNAYGCWLKDVEVNEAANYNLYFINGIHCEVRHSNLSHIQGSGNNGACVLVEYTSLSLFEDNIIGDGQPHVEVNFGCSGNVFGYNFFHTPVNEFGIDTNHGPGNAYNLYEGNVTYQIGSDAYFGSESYCTIFRNRVYGGGGGACLESNRFSRNFAVVENVLGDSSTATYNMTSNGNADQPTIYRLGYPNLGNDGYTGTAEPSTGDYWADWGDGGAALPSGYQERDLDVANTILRKKNYCSTEPGIPASEADANVEPYSLYYTSKPSWFDAEGTLNWPAYGTDGHTTYGTAESDYSKIPAAIRYFA